jgi:hypothetical protein
LTLKLTTLHLTLILTLDRPHWPELLVHAAAS